MITIPFIVVSPGLMVQIRGGVVCRMDCKDGFAARMLPRQRGSLVMNHSWFFPLGFPRGEAVATKQRRFGTGVFVVTDEGWRQLKVPDFSVECKKLGHLPLIQLHS